jgi:predicted dehydrogenase
MKIAVFGLGFMGSTHLKALRNIPGAELVAVMSNVEKQLTGDLSEIQGNIGGPGEKMDFSRVRKYRSVEEALRDPEIEAVDICLPTHFHAQAAIDALRAGKHVLVEKPIALTGADADWIIAEAEKAGRVVMAAQVVRFIGPYRAAASMLRSGKLGAVRAAIFRRRCAAPFWSQWLADPAQSGGGVFDLLIHDVDFCLHVFGMPTAVSATGYEDLPKGVDWILARFEYPGIGSVSVTGGWHHPKSFPFSMEFTIVTDGGTLEFHSANRPLTLYGADGSECAIEIPEADGYQSEIEYFLECAAAGRKPGFCPPEESASAVKLGRAMLASRAGGGTPVKA